MFRIRPVLALLAALTALAAVTSCTSSDDKKDDSTASLPDGATLLKDSATAMGEIKTAKFLITADGAISGLSLRRAEGTLTREGDAEGTAQIEQAGTNVDLTFVIVGDKIYIKGPTGGYQELPLSLAATVYDPSAILDPDKGIAKVLSTATGAKTEAAEAVDGTDAWRVAMTANGADLATIIPGVSGDVPGKVWIGQQDKRLHKAVFTLPAEGGATGTVTVTFQEFDAPATIKAP
ncbi:LppX_LprAFG lipoprotein [Paractinoplanes globisporus]|jgi:lipoprotein LprG|uniref:LppX_LprAFG lipoprotein n=1 Tax=Paractinoplanes globisporus TaxID=113565 RepID=A0ABW6WT49_9ACTN|nr:LppX_LprAFG lipoprotein [Actinoplanes globisporus]